MTEYKQGRFLAVALIIAAVARPALLPARAVAAVKAGVAPPAAALAKGVVGPSPAVAAPILASELALIPPLGVSVLAAPVALTPALAAVAASDKQAVSGLKTAVRSLTSLQALSIGDAVHAVSAELGRLFENASAGGSPEVPVVGGSLDAAVRSLESIVELKVGFYNVLNFFVKVGKHVPDPDNPGRLKKVSDAKPKPEWAVREQGRIILENDLDIVTLAEVENIVALEDFNERYLGGAYRAYLIEGNDQRGIDIAFLVKKDLPFVVEQRSHKDETWVDPILGGGPKTLFSRDLTALVVRAPGKDRPLFVIFGTHYKSKRDRDGRDPESTILRAAQVRRSAEIIARYRKEFGPEVPIMVAGDFNGSVGREAAFDPLFKAAGLTDSFDALPNPPSDRDRITHTYHPGGGAARSAQMDAVLVSKRLRAAVKNARVYRYKNSDGTVRPIPKTYEEREKNPSDHFPVIVTLDFAPMRTANASGVEAEDDEIAAMMPKIFSWERDIIQKARVDTVLADIPQNVVTEQGYPEHIKLIRTKEKDFILVSHALRPTRAQEADNGWIVDTEVYSSDGRWAILAYHRERYLKEKRRAEEALRKEIARWNAMNWDLFAAELQDISPEAGGGPDLFHGFDLAPRLQHFGLPAPLPPYSEEQEKFPINKSLAVRELMNDDGSIYLFRAIFEPYIPGFISPGAGTMGFISYSINPLLFINDIGFPRVNLERHNTHILIAKQRLAENLTYVTDRRKDIPRKRPLAADTTMGDFGIQYEVEVRSVSPQNVIKVMPFKEFVRLISSVRSIDDRADYERTLALLFGRQVL